MSNCELHALGGAECCDSRLCSRQDRREPLRMVSRIARRFGGCRSNLWQQGPRLRCSKGK